MFSRLLRRLRTGGSKGPAEVAERERYKGLELQARPMREGGLWRVAGRICRPDAPDGARHDFIRVDTMASHEEAVRMSLIKARLIVDERGDAVLADEADTPARD